MVSVSWRMLRSLINRLFTESTRVSSPSHILLVALTTSCIICIDSITSLSCAFTCAVFIICSDAFGSSGGLLLLFSIEQVRILCVNFSSSYAWASDGKTWLLKCVSLIIRLQAIYTLVVLCYNLFFKTIEFYSDKLNRLCQILAAILEFALHLATASQIIADNGFVIGIKRVRILCFDHDLISFEKALHASFPFSLILCVQLFYCLFI